MRPRVPEAWVRATDAVRTAYDGLNARERVLVAALGSVFAALLVLLPLYLVLDSISEMERENQEIAQVLGELSDSRERIEQERVEREQARAQYGRKAPPLGSFIEARANEVGITLREVNDQPPLAMGEFTRRRVRASLPNVNLRPVIKMLSAIEQSDYPVATERIQVDHTRDGDNYTFQIGINAYDRSDSEQGEGGPSKAKQAPSRGRQP